MFTLQLGHPKINTIPAQNYKQVKDVFLKLFHSEEERVFIFWNEIPLSFRYKEDLHQCFDDILAMLWLLQKEKKGESKVKLTNQIVDMNLELYWDDDALKISAHFKAHEELYATYEDMLNKKSQLIISKDAFLSEWNTLLHQIITSFKAGDITIDNGTESRKLDLLFTVESAINNYGKLYVR